MSELEYPGDLSYTTDHEWIKVDAGVARVGITAYAQNALGDVVYVSLPAIGDDLEAGASCGEVESTKSVSDVFAPLSGQVVAVNDALDSSPELLNTDPYGAGWMFEIKLADGADLSSLLDAAAYQAQLD